VKGALAAAVVAGCAGVEAPELEAATPAAARRGEAIVLDGTGFCVPDCDASPEGSVAFGVEIPQIRAVVETWDETSIQVVVPQSVELGATEIVVTVNDRSSNALDFEVLP
jgi:hypothetical protein